MAASRSRRRTSQTRRKGSGRHCAVRELHAGARALRAENSPFWGPTRSLCVRGGCLSGVVRRGRLQVLGGPWVGVPRLGGCPAGLHCVADGTAACWCPRPSAMLTDAMHMASLPPRKRLAMQQQQGGNCTSAEAEVPREQQSKAGAEGPLQALTPTELAPPVPKKPRTALASGGKAGQQQVPMGPEALEALAKANALRAKAQKAIETAVLARQVRSDASPGGAGRYPFPPARVWAPTRGYARTRPSTLSCHS